MAIGVLASGGGVSVGRTRVAHWLHSGQPVVWTGRGFMKWFGMEERGGVGSGIAGHRRPATIALLWPSAPTPQHQLSTQASRLDPHGCTCSIPLSTWAAISTAVGLPDCSWMALALAARIQRPPLPSLTEEARRVRKLSTFCQIVFPGGGFYLLLLSDNWASLILADFWP